MSAQTHTAYTCDTCGKVASTEREADHWFHITMLRDRAPHTLLMIEPYDKHFCDHLCAIAALAKRVVTETDARRLVAEIAQRQAAQRDANPPDMVVCVGCSQVYAYKDVWLAADKTLYCPTCWCKRTDR